MLWIVLGGLVALRVLWTVVGLTWLAWGGNGTGGSGNIGVALLFLLPEVMLWFWVEHVMDRFFNVRG